MPLTNYQENLFLEDLFNNTTIYLAASTTTPTKVGGNVTEPVGSGYARITTAAGDWTVAATGALENANDLSHAEATGAWGTITYVVLYDALTNGNCLGYAALDVSKAPVAGQILRYAAGEIDVAFAQA